MDNSRFDDLVRSFRPGATRRRALRLLGSGVLAGALAPALALDGAEAGAKKRCRKKNGDFLGAGECKCALTCHSDSNKFPCPFNESCYCFEGVDGLGFCGDGNSTSSGCSATAECNPGSKCIIQRGCPGSVTSCSTSGQCNTGRACISGQCELTACATPCGL
jgi:hypothetical protein